MAKIVKVKKAGIIERVQLMSRGERVRHLWRS